MSEIEVRDPARTIAFWKKHLMGIDKKMLEMVVFTNRLEDRDRLTRSHLDDLIKIVGQKRISN